MRSRFGTAVFLAGLLAVAVVAAVWHTPAPTVRAVSVITVNTTNDSTTIDLNDQECTLREAIISADSDLDYGDCAVFEQEKRIEFNLPGPGTPVINLGSDLPVISNDGITIYGGTKRVELRAQYTTSQGVLQIGTNAPNTVIDHLAVSNFGRYGPAISVKGAGSTIKGSYIGTVGNGTTGLNNAGDGIDVEADNVTIGGTNGITPGGSCTGDCNLMSAMEYGLIVGGSRPTANARIIGNFIGSEPTGQNSITTGTAGILIANFATDTEIGGSGPGEGNLIGGYSRGVHVPAGTGTVIKGNRIGTETTGTTKMGDTSGNGYPISLEGTPNTIVGGTSAGEGNTLAFMGVGVYVDGAQTVGNPIRGNSIFSNFQGIKLATGGNTELVAPAITAADHSGASGTSCGSCLIDVYSDADGQGKDYEGSTTAAANGTWSFNEPLAGPNVTATATDSGNNTSEFSAPFTLPNETPTPSPTPSATQSATPTHTVSPTTSPTAHASGTPTATPSGVRGDANCDQEVTLSDLEAVLSQLVGVSPGAPCADRTDVNCNGHLDVDDALRILAFKAGTPLAQPSGCPSLG